jgi:hypothetical protein
VDLRFYSLFATFAEEILSVTGRKLQHICGELFGVIKVETLGKMLIMSRDFEC